MSVIKTKFHMVTTKQHRIEIGRAELLVMLRKVYPNLLPDDVGISVTVPGGGDWSNMGLDIGVDVPLEITWTTREENTDDD